MPTIEELAGPILAAKANEEIFAALKAGTIHAFLGSKRLPKSYWAKRTVADLRSKEYEFDPAEMKRAFPPVPPMPEEYWSLKPQLLTLGGAGWLSMRQCLAHIMAAWQCDVRAAWVQLHRAMRNGELPFEIVHPGGHA